jgi:hypothetical protein
MSGAAFPNNRAPKKLQCVESGLDAASPSGGTCFRKSGFWPVVDIP